MALSDKYVQVYGKLPEFFQTLSRGQAPEQFTIQHLKDIGFGSSNFRAVIPLLKELGFLTDVGEPTQRYHDYRNSALSRRVMGEAVRQAYGDLFVIRSNPKEEDRPLLEGKFKSAHNVNERLAKLMASTFFALLDLADLSVPQPAVPPPDGQGSEGKGKQKEHKEHKDGVPGQQQVSSKTPAPPAVDASVLAGLHYNIQIHLPATKDVEVFNAIFKSLKEHFLA